MKTIKNISILLLAISSFSSCKKDSPTTPEIKLSESSIDLEIGQEKTISISGGNGTYTISPTASDVADATLSGATLEITAKKEGSQTFVITSADKKAALMVKVNPLPIPDLGSQLGAYKDGKLLLSYSMTSRTKNGIWLCEKSQNPYSKRLFLPFVVRGVQIGQEIDIEILSEGVSSIDNTKNQPRSVKVRVEKITGKIIQLQGGNLRFVCELK